MLVGYRLSGKLVGGKMMIQIRLGVTAHTVMNAILYPRIGQDMLQASARNRAARKGVALHDYRPFGKHRLHAQRFEFAPIKNRPKIREAAVGSTGKPGTEIVLAAGIELQILS